MQGEPYSPLSLCLVGASDSPHLDSYNTTRKRHETRTFFFFFFFSVHTREKKDHNNNTSQILISVRWHPNALLFFSLSLILLACSLARFSHFLLLLLLCVYPEKRKKNKVVSKSAFHSMTFQRPPKAQKVKLFHTTYQRKRQNTTTTVPPEFEI